MAKRFSVALTRTTVETATVIVEAPDRKSAPIYADRADKVWQPVSVTEKVGRIADAPASPATKAV